MALIPTGQAPDDYRRKLAYKLMMEGTDASPVQHWAQGLARLGQGALGGYEMYQADEKDKATSAEEAAAMVAALRGPDAPAASTGAPQAAPGAPMAVPGGTARPTTGKIYSNDEPSPLDPPQGEDRIRMAATIAGEAANQPAVGQNAVASVIRSRAVNGGYGGDTPSGVVTARNQFEPWNTESGRARMARALANPEIAAKADQAIAMAYGEGGNAPNDPTNGAMNFYAPKTQAALGREAPAWDRPGQMIGDHKFIGGQPQGDQQPYQVAGPPTAAPQTAPQAPPQQAASDPRRDQIIQFLQGTPAQQKIGKALASQYIQQQFKPVEKTNEIKNYEYGKKDTGFNSAQTEQKAREAAAVENAKKSATAQAEAKADLPASAAKRDTAVETINKVRNHPGRGDFGAAGTTAGLASFRPGSRAYDFKIAVDQLKGQSFLQAYEALKGGGAIANAEGAKAEAAIARLDRAQTPEAFDEALTDYQNAIERGFAAMEQKAGVAQQPAQSGGAVIWERGPDGKPRRKQ